MKRNTNFYFLALFSFINLIIAQAQITPGLIIDPANYPGNTVLDPDLDGYVSSKTNGIQMGFTNPPGDDISQSEIPYVYVVKPDPEADILRGGTGGATEIIGTDAAGNNAVMTYTDGVNLLYRFRIDSYSKATLSYSVLIDTDGKFGFTGVNADPNAVVGNLGFEIEVNLQSNFRVVVYKIDGTTTPVEVYTSSNLTHQQKAVAYSTAGGNPDYFYDFYVPLSALTSIVFSSPTTPTSITASTPLRYAAVTCLNPSPFTGNSAVSDIGGVTPKAGVDEILINIINSQTPTPAGTTSLQASDCPVINAVGASSTTISGTSTEAFGTLIKVEVFNSTGTLLGSANTTTTGTSWSVNVSALSPTVTLATGQIVKATATAVDKGASFGCVTTTVTSCSVKTTLPNTSPNTTEVVGITAGKGFAINLSGRNAASGTIVTLYKADYTLHSGTYKNSITNPYSTVCQCLKYVDRSKGKTL